MVGLTAEEFTSWLRPRDALSKLGAADEAALKYQIAAMIVDGRIRIAAKESSESHSEHGQASQPVLVDLSYLRENWICDWGRFWSLGQISFVHNPTTQAGFASLIVVAIAASSSRPEVHTFGGVRLDPLAVAREFDLDMLAGSAVHHQKEPLVVPKGGRPAGKDGGPIARLTLRMSAKSPEELRRYTAEALKVELIEEYCKEGLVPPSEANARRNAAGILSVVRP